MCPHRCLGWNAGWHTARHGEYCLIASGVLRFYITSLRGACCILHGPLAGSAAHREKLRAGAKTARPHAARRCTLAHMHASAQLLSSRTFNQARLGSPACLPVARSPSPHSLARPPTRGLNRTHASRTHAGAEWRQLRGWGWQSTRPLRTRASTSCSRRALYRCPRAPKPAMHLSPESLPHRHASRRVVRPDYSLGRVGCALWPLRRQVLVLPRDRAGGPQRTHSRSRPVGPASPSAPPYARGNRDSRSHTHTSVLDRTAALWRCVERRGCASAWMERAACVGQRRTARAIAPKASESDALRRLAPLAAAQRMGQRRR